MRTIERKNQQILKLKKLMTIIRAFHYYFHMKSKSEFIEKKFTKAEAKVLSENINEIFDAGTTPNDFIYNDENLATEALDYYALFKNELKAATKLALDENALTSLCKQIYYNPEELMYLRCFGHFFLHVQLNNIINFLMGDYSRLSRKRILLDSLARDTFIKIEKRFSELEKEQAERKYR